MRKIFFFLFEFIIPFASFLTLLPAHSTLTSIIIFISLIVTKIHYENTRITILLQVIIFLPSLYPHIACQIISFLLSFSINLFCATYAFPQPTGKFQVGYKTLRLLNQQNYFMTIFYGCENLKLKKISAHYLQIPLNLHIEHFHSVSKLQCPRYKSPPPKFFPLFLYSFHSKLKLSYTPEKPNLKKYQIVLFFHNIASHSNNYTTILQELASQGYFAISIDFCAETIYPENYWTELVKRNDSSKYLQFRLNQINSRVSIANEIIVNLEKNNFEFLSELGLSNANVFDFQNIIAIGHGFGAIPALQLSFINKNVTTVIALDPWMDFLPQQCFNSGLTAASLFLSLYDQSPHQKSNKQMIAELIKNSSEQKNKISCSIFNSSTYHFSDECFLNPVELEYSQSIDSYDHLMQQICELKHVIITFLQDSLHQREISIKETQWLFVDK